MTKSVIEIALQAGGVKLITPSGFGANAKTKTNSHIAMTPDALERLEAAIKAAHLAELAGGEMPLSIGYVYSTAGEALKSAVIQRDVASGTQLFTLDQCQQAVAAAVARKDAEIAGWKADQKENLRWQVEQHEQIQALTAELAKKDAEIAQRDKHLVEYNTRINAEVTKLLNEKDALTAERDDLLLQLDKEGIKEMRAEIAFLKAERDALNVSLMTANAFCKSVDAPPAAVPLTKEAYTALAHRIASKYAHRSDPQYIAYTFLPHTLDDFVRAIEAAHGITGEKR